PATNDRHERNRPGRTREHHRGPKHRSPSAAVLGQQTITQCSTTSPDALDGTPSRPVLPARTARQAPTILPAATANTLQRFSRLHAMLAHPRSIGAMESILDPFSYKSKTMFVCRIGCRVSRSILSCLQLSTARPAAG